MPIQFPPGFIDILNQSLPHSEACGVIDGMELTAQTSVRLNLQKGGKIKNELISSIVPHCNNAFLLKERPSFVADPAFHAGYYYVQEASSSIIGTVLQHLIADLEPGIKVLDLCAAPGGKSTHIASVLKYGDVLVANETIFSRTPVLKENLDKWGAGNHLITRADASAFGKSAARFKIIVADMPCSGEGLFRKDGQAMNEWSPQNVDMCADRQKRIATDVWPALEENGFFIYSTCTFNKKENEENVRWICENLGAEITKIKFPDTYSLFENDEGLYRLLPHRTSGEGMFFAVLRKMVSTKSEKISRNNKLSFYKEFNHFFTKNFSVFEWNKSLQTIALDSEAEIQHILSSLPNIYSPGVALGKVYHNELKPDTAIAMLSDFAKNSFPVNALNDSEVIPYLKRESFKNPEKKDGMHLMRWNNINLGFANGVKQNWNNLWPMEWRIRKDFAEPETIIVNQ